MSRSSMFAFAAFVLMLAASGPASAQPRPVPAPAPAPAPAAPEPPPAPFVFALPEINIDINAEELRANAEQLKANVEELKANVKAMKPFKLEGDMFKLDMDLGNLTAKFAADFDANFQGPRPPGTPGPPVMIRAGGGRGDDEDRAYQSGTRALDSARWDEAVMQFQRVVALGGPRADGATYWAAWAQNKQGNGSGALTSLTKLREAFPNSKWLTEGRALEVEIRQAAGQPVRPENVPDDELKLMALNTLMRGDAERAIPMVDKILRGTGSPRLKDRALYVLAQNGTPQARQIVIDVAKGAGNPDLQAKAVGYLGAIGGPETKAALPEIYKATTNVEVKRSILRAFMTAGDRAHLLDLAKTEPSVELRAEAVQQLGAMGAQEELGQLYQSEQSADVRKRIIQSMFAGHNEAKLIQLLRTESVQDLKRSIVQNLGMMASPTSAEALNSVYASDKTEVIRRAVIDAFGQQRNSKALVDLAKKETDPVMKKRIVERLSNMKSTEATDYFLDLLNQP